MLMELAENGQVNRRNNKQLNTLLRVKLSKFTSPVMGLAVVNSKGCVIPSQFFSQSFRVSASTNIMKLDLAVKPWIAGVAVCVLFQQHTVLFHMVHETLVHPVYSVTMFSSSV